jgi:tetratricopeptide (TPR) repeat protein/lysophospholipase L1-like esterase
MKRILPKLAKPLLALAATLLTLGACELAMRAMGTTPEIIPIGISSEDRIYRRSTNPYLSYELKPDYHHDDADLKFDHPRTNSHGQRDVERRWDKPPGVRRIILLGDSVVVGFGIREIDHLMSRQLERLYPEGAVEVLNLAVSGYCTRSEVELLKVKGVRYDPDLVILVFVENDFHNFNREARYTDGITGRPWIVNSLYRGSHLFRSTCLNFNWFGFGIEADPARWNQQAIGHNNVSEGFQLLRELALKNRFETVVVLWPAFTNSEITYNDIMLMPETPDQLIAARLARMHGLTAVGLDEPFRRHWQSLTPRPNPRIYYTVAGDEMHPTIEGHRATARILKEIIDRYQLLRPSESLRTVTAPTAEDRSALLAAIDLGKEKSDYSAVRYNLGKELMQAGKTDQAIREFQETIRLNPRYAPDAHNDIGFILFERGQVDQAIDHYRKALDLSPGNYFALVNLGNALRVQGRLDEALGPYRRAVHLRPEKLEGHYNLGSALAAKGDYAQAVDHLAVAARTDPKDAKIARRLGEAYERLGQADQATAQLRRAVELEPENHENHNRLGQALVRARRTDEATAAFRQGVAHLPNNAQLHFNLGKALSSSGQLDEARKHLETSCQLSPSNANALNSLGVTLAKMGRVDEAVEKFTQALKLEPNHQNARRNLANARALKGRGADR